ncbi:MAG: DUF742 domain-containing protein [Pseudonocardiaceae bacterium]
MEEDRNSRGRRRAGGPVVGQTGARFGGTAGRRSRAAAEPPEEDGAVAAQHQSQQRHEDQAVGQTGARFPSLLNRRRHNPPEQDPEQQEAQPTATPAPAGQQALPPPEVMPPASAPDQVPEPERIFEPDWLSEPDPAEAADWGRLKESYDLVRPYFWTGGRTAARVDLAVETLVSATGRPPEPPARPEHRTILQICATPHSVAELAALLSIPLGVARVVLGDLAATGSVAVHRTISAPDAAPDVALMQRVLNGLQRL